MNKRRDRRLESAEEIFHAIRLPSAILMLESCTNVPWIYEGLPAKTQHFVCQTYSFLLSIFSLSFSFVRTAESSLLRCYVKPTLLALL